MASSWAASFWTQVVDPQTQELIYCCPATGECRWQLEPGTFVVPWSAAGQHWELQGEDDTVYYYSTADKRSTWNRPHDGVIIPLQAVQDANGHQRRQPRVSMTSTDANDSLASAHPSSAPSTPSTLATSRAPESETSTSKLDRQPRRPRAPTPGRMRSSPSSPLLSPSQSSEGISRGRHQTTQALLPTSASSPSRLSSAPRRNRAATAPAAETERDLRRFTGGIEPPKPPRIYQPRSGLLRRRVPLDTILQHQDVPLTAPLLHLPRQLRPLALEAFRHILAITSRTDPGLWDEPALLHAQALCELGLAHPGLRDEVWLQTIKQLNGVTTRTRALNGWAVVQLLVSMFPPTSALQSYLDDFLRSATYIVSDRIDVVARYCRRQLAALAVRGARGRTLIPLVEIEAMSRGAFLKRCFGESLKGIMRHQIDAADHHELPAVVSFLFEQLDAADAKGCEGIFRVPGDINVVNELRIRLDCGVFDLRDSAGRLPEAFVLGSLLKLWLRELREPVIPTVLYSRCLSSLDEETESEALLGALPALHRRVLQALVAYLQGYLVDDVRAKTHMTAANLAMCFAPGLFRPTLVDMATARTNALKENAFVERLLLSDRA